MTEQATLACSSSALCDRSPSIIVEALYHGAHIPESSHLAI